MKLCRLQCLCLREKAKKFGSFLRHSKTVGQNTAEKNLQIFIMFFESEQRILMKPEQKQLNLEVQTLFQSLCQLLSLCRNSPKSREGIVQVQTTEKIVLFFF